ncbi:flagellar basal-body rod protein FlgF [Breoghania sp. L-A4]|uniref:flagellar basal-body rod protein FlgF n=1 Tax=Breoghania sp. L-A4 TaxID=2304600 RepID=UPI000E3580DF|nr:flagellar basal-body rod protein FlgF [Breoghania sp. L-A4]AXS41210.1 flagellar basal-body rod protein FlgF [Breoghania sp. L-A4]
MENAELIGLTRQTALMRKLDVIANNLANLNTTGYKGQNLIFEEYLMPVAEASEFPRRDETLSYVHDYQSFHDFSTGSITLSGNPLDVAIEDEGFFVIETAQGERYTRSGNFQTDTEGQIVTSDGRPVLGDGGPITLGPTDTAITIARDGTISSENGVRGKLRIVRFEEPQAMQNQGDNLFTGENPIDVDSPRLSQGAIEGSNVRGVVEMTRMIQVTRDYQSITKMMKEQDDLLKRAINSLGSLEA